MLPSDLVNYKKKSRKIIALTAWDSISGSIAEQANVDLVLVGDSLAMVCLGYKSTLPLTLENIIYHTNAVSRGFKNNFEVHHMSFYKYWDPQENFYYASKNCGFETNQERTEGTYSKYSSIDDKVDNFHYYKLLYLQ